MYIDYQDAIVRYYRFKKGRKEIEPRLLNASPARLKKECAAICPSRFTRKDLPALRTFFGEASTVKEMLVLIEDCKLSRFKPLVNLLKKDGYRADDAIFDLLGWLIDFPHRPYDMAVDYSKFFVEDTTVIADGESELKYENGQGDSGTSSKESETGEELPPPPDDPSPDPVAKKNGTRKLVLVASLILLFALSGIFFTKTIHLPFGSAKNHECMVWVNDHYEPTNCEPRYGVDVVALEPDFGKNFRLITRPDTITEKSIGDVGYISRNNRKEFYTSVGPHPIERHRHLRPLSKYMYTKYIVPLKGNKE